MGRIAVIAPGYADHATEAAVADRHGRAFGIIDGTAPREEFLEALQGVEIAFLRDVRLDAEAIGAMAEGGGIIRYGVGYDGVDLDAATARGIRVANIPDYGADADVADHTLALFMTLVRRVATRDRDVRAGNWGVGQSEPIHRIAGRVLGLVGYGRIGRAVHRRFAALGIDRVLVHDPYLPEETARGAGVEAVDLATLATEASVISLHAPPTKDGALIDTAILRRMRRDAVLLNTARGALVDEAALIAALSEGRIAGAGLDVLAQEPPDPANPLLRMPNVVVTDHTGWYSESSVDSLQRQAAEEADRMLSGEAVRHWVNPW